MIDSQETPDENTDKVSLNTFYTVINNNIEYVKTQTWLLTYYGLLILSAILVAYSRFSGYVDGCILCAIALTATVIAGMLIFIGYYFYNDDLEFYRGINKHIVWGEKGKSTSYLTPLAKAIYTHHFKNYSPKLSNSYFKIMPQAIFGLGWIFAVIFILIRCYTVFEGCRFAGAY